MSDIRHRSIMGARLLRKKMTAAETLLWKYLDNRGMCGVKFRRQHPIDRFVFDFYCSAAKLAIEVDGGIHIKSKEADAERQRALEGVGIEFLRFKNKDIMENLDSVLKIIKRKVYPSPRSGEGWHDEVVTG